MKKLKTGLLLLTSQSLLDLKQRLVFDVFELAREDSTHIIVALPNIAFNQLGELVTEFEKCATHDLYCMSMLFYDRYIGDDAHEATDRRLEVGAHTSKRKYVHFFPREIFESDPNALAIFFLTTIADIQS